MCITLCGFHVSVCESDTRYCQSNVGIDFNYALYSVGELSPMSGYLAGGHFDFCFKKPQSALVGIYFDGRWNAGHLCSPNDCDDLGDVRSNVSDYITSVHLGYNFTNCSNTTMYTPVTGIGLYCLSTELTPSIIRYKYYNLHVPVGCELQWDLNHCFSLNLHAVYRIDAYTRLKITTPCVDVCDTLRVKRSHGLSVSLPMKRVYSFCRRVNLQTTCIPFFDWNRFGEVSEKSECCIPIAVPEWKRWYLGIKFLVGLSF